MALSALLFALAAQQGGPLLSSVLPKPPAPDQVVARVNGEPILAREVSPYLWDWRGSEVAQDLVTYHLIMGAAKKAGIRATVPEIQKAFDARLAAMRAEAPPGSDAEEILRAKGFPKSRLYLRVHTDLLLDGLVMRSFSPAGYVRVSTLPYRPASDGAQEISAAIERAQGAYDRLVKGGSWATELQATDADAGLKSRNGILGWRMISAFPASTRRELTTAKPGGLTKPVQAGGAIQIFRIEDLGAAAKGADLAELRTAYLASERQGFIDALRKSAKIERVYVPKG
jgi:hypothetical protein